MSTILQKTTSAGVSIEVRMREYLPGQHIAQLFIEGQFVSGASRPTPLNTPKNGATHWMGQSKPGKAVGFTQAEADQINAALDAADAAARETPEAQAQKLTYQREALVAAVQGAEEDRDADSEQGHESDGSAAYAAAKPHEARIEAAQQALREFDAAHPEVAAQVQAARLERAARNQWM